MYNCAVKNAQRQSEQMEKLVFGLANQLMRINLDDIVYVKSDGNYSQVCLYNGVKQTMTIQLHYFEDKIKATSKDNKFGRIGRSVLVNKDYICMINLTEKQLLLSGHKMMDKWTISASREALKEVKDELEKQETRR